MRDKVREISRLAEELKDEHKGCRQAKGAESRAKALVLLRSTALQLYALLGALIEQIDTPPLEEEEVEISEREPTAPSPTSKLRLPGHAEQPQSYRSEPVTAEDLKLFVDLAAGLERDLVPLSQADRAQVISSMIRGADVCYAVWRSGEGYRLRLLRSVEPAGTRRRSPASRYPVKRTRICWKRQHRMERRECADDRTSDDTCRIRGLA